MTDAAAELEVLFPDVEVEVADGGGKVSVTVREFRFAESLRARPVARPVSEALAAAVPDDPDGEMPSAAAIEAAMGEHAEAWLELLGRACGRDPEWLGRLSDADGAALSMAMWEANGPFFVRLAVAVLRGRAGTERLFRSLASSTNSSAPATEPDTPTSPDA